MKVQVLFTSAMGLWRVRVFRDLSKSLVPHKVFCLCILCVILGIEAN